MSDSVYHILFLCTGNSARSIMAESILNQLGQGKFKAPPLDGVITLCGDAAQEACPIMPGRPASAHWGLPDPAAVSGSPAEQKQAFVHTLQSLTQRLATLVQHHTPDRQALQQYLQAMEEE